MKGVGKMPKAPKHSASKKSWENYNKRLSAYKAKKRKVISDKKAKENLIKRAERLRGGM